jgi:hypothetical protein
VRDHHPARQPGGTRRVLQVGDVVWQSRGQPDMV